MSSQPLSPSSDTAIIEPNLARKHYYNLQILKSLQNRQANVESEDHSLYAHQIDDNNSSGRTELERGLSWISRALVPIPNQGHIAAVCLSKEVADNHPSVFLNISSNEPKAPSNGGSTSILLALLKELFTEQEAHLANTGSPTIDPAFLESQSRALQDFIISHCWKSFLGRMEDICGLPLPSLRPDDERDRAVSDLTGQRKGYIDDYVRVLTYLHTTYTETLETADSATGVQTGDLEGLMATFRHILELSTDAKVALKKARPLAADRESKVALFNQMVELCNQLLKQSSLLVFAANFTRRGDRYNREHEVPTPARLAEFGIKTTHGQFAFLAKIHRRVDRLVQYRKGSMSVVNGVFAEIRAHCRSGHFHTRMAQDLVPELRNGKVKPKLTPKDYVGALIQMFCDDGRLNKLTVDEIEDVKRKVQDSWKKGETIHTRVHCEVRLVHTMAKLAGNTIINNTFAVSKRCCLSCHHYLTSLLASSEQSWRFSGCSWKPHHGWKAPVPTTPSNAWFTDEATRQAISETYDAVEKQVKNAIAVFIRGGVANSGSDTSYSARESAEHDFNTLKRAESNKETNPIVPT